MLFEQDQPQDFIYLSVNAAFETLTGLKNVAGKRVSEVIPGIRQSDAGLFEIYGRVSLSGKPEQFEIYVEALQQWFWISVYSPEKGYFLAAFDIITERKKYEEELKRSNAELEQFGYAISHDMRQPLRMISSYLQLIEISLSDQLDSEKRDYFNFAIDGAKRIDQMLVALLEYSRVGRMGELPRWIESRAVFDEALLFLQPAINEAQARLDISGDWPSIFVNHDEILRLMQNLIGNAAKFRVAGRTPEITITGKMGKNEWHLCVADNGIGLIPDQIKRLFQMFQRLQLRAVYEGNGVGLALCRKIVEHHKGRIWAESAGESQGSKFHVVLPVPPRSK
jgi:light-regulated signal transduction histidine kinase (bacteriophytochrome)